MSNEDLIRRWVAGWCASRALSLDTAADGVLAVHVGEPGRSVEFLVLDADRNPDRVDRAAALARSAGGTAWVTVATDHLEDRLDQLTSAGLDIKPGPECLMTIALTPEAGLPMSGPSVVIAPYVVDCDADSDIVVARAMIDGVVAATGRMALVGTDAIADRIETDPAHRRRGLGRAVMAALVAGATGRGATHGVLGASTDGRALYQALGWSVVADLAIATTV